MTVRAKVLRRRTKPSLAARVKTFWVLAALGVVAALAVAYAIADAPQLRVRSVDAVVPAGGPVSTHDVLAAARVEPSANLWLLDTGAIRQRVEAIPYVDRSEVHRAQFPQPAVSLAVTLRRPTGCVRSANGVVTIDATARILQTGCVDAALPLVDVGPNQVAAPGSTLNAPDVMQLLADATTIGRHLTVRVVRRDRYGGIEAVDPLGVVLKFGTDDGLEQKLALVEPIRRSVAGDRPVRAIDLRAPDTPVVEFR